MLVFVPLDVMFEWKSTSVYQFPAGLAEWLHWLTQQLFSAVFFTIVAVAMLYLGIRMEAAATVALQAEEGGSDNANRHPTL